MNLTDLRAVLDERSSAELAPAGSHLTLAAVRRRLVLRRRRRVAAAGLAVVAVLAAGAGTLTVNRPHPDRPAPAASLPIPTVSGFPEYAAGARVFAASPPLRSGDTTLRLTFVPPSTDLIFFVRCAGGGSGKLYRLALNGRPDMGGTGCGNTFNEQAPYGVRVGSPSTLIVTFPNGAEPGFAVAVGVKVPVSQYAFPPRPAVLAPIDPSDGLLSFGDPSGEYQTTKLVRPDPADPNTPVRFTFTWGKGAHLLLRSQTPGALTVSVDGVTVTSGEWWDYGQTLIDGGDAADWLPAGKRVPGTTATMTIAPTRMTGDWAVAYQERR